MAFLSLTASHRKTARSISGRWLGKRAISCVYEIVQIGRDERKLRRLIPSLFHREGKPIPYATLDDAWRAAARAGYPGKLMHDFRRTAATRLDSTPGISRSLAMTLLGAQDRHHVPQVYPAS